MNRYSHHIGDFNTATRHLSRLERSIYRDMLDMYYDTETALDGSDMSRLARRLCCVTAEEVDALQFVLDEFFEQVEHGLWLHHRCEREIASYRAQQAERGAVKQNENSRQARSRARRAAMFSALREVGIVPPAVTKMADLARMCAEAGVAVPSEHHVTPHVTGHAVTCHGDGTGNQNHNQNQDIPPNPPAGGAGAGTAIATALASHFPLKRRSRIADVADKVDELIGAGAVTGDVLLLAAAQQSKQLHADDGKACPGVLRWLREQRWLDSSTASVSANWSETRSGTEAMGKRVGLPPFDDSGYRLLSDYRAEIERRLVPDEVQA